MAISLRQICGFEEGNVNDPEAVFFNHGGTYSIQRTTVRHGDYALRVNPTGTGEGWVQFVGQSSPGLHTDLSASTLYVRFWFRYATAPDASSSEEIAASFTTYTSARKAHLRLEVDATDKARLALYGQDGTTKIATGSTPLVKDHWYDIAWKIGTESGEANNDAAYEVMLNGVTELSGTGDLGVGVNNRFHLGKTTNRNGNSVDFYYDDLVLAETDYPSRPKILRMEVDADGTSRTGNFNASSGSKHECVDDIDPGTQDGHDGDTSYVYTQHTTTDYYAAALESCSSAGISGTIQGVQVYLVSRYVSGYDGGLEPRVYDGTSEGTSAMNSDTTSWRARNKIWQDKPSGGTWTTTALDSSEVVVRCWASANMNERVTFMALMVLGVGELPDPVESVKIIDPDGSVGVDCDYTSLASWSSSEARDLTACNEVPIARCRCTGGTADSQTNISDTDGWSGADADRHLRIEVETGYRHNGTYQTGNVYRIEYGAVCLDIRVPYTEVVGVEAKNTGSGADVFRARYGTPSPTYVIFRDCVAVADSGSAGTGVGFYLGRANQKAINCLSINHGTGTAYNVAGFWLLEDNTLAYNCDAIGSGYGFMAYGSGLGRIAKNCLAKGANTKGFDTYFGSWSTACRNCASSDAYVPDQGSGHRTSQTFTFVDEPNDDYHLASSDTGAKDYGVDLSTDPDGFYSFNNDVDGNVRSGDWDIGFDEASEEAYSAWTKIKDNLTASAWTHSGLVNGKKYRYKVRAIDDSGNPSNFSNEVEVTPAAGTAGDPVPPRLPARRKAVAILEQREDDLVEG